MLVFEQDLALQLLEGRTGLEGSMVQFEEVVLQLVVENSSYSVSLLLVGDIQFQG